MMQKLLLRKFRAHPSCVNQMKPIRLSRTPKTRDDIIYTFSDGVYRLFKVEEIGDVEKEYLCKEYNVSNKTFRRHQTLDFGVVGVFRNHGYKMELVTVQHQEICGKLVSIGSLLFTVSINVLTEY